ncbi:protein pxr1 [Forsythia ovata]|uniref:Protein pxr1 n=1 Tax=Forsythia ovata TaxID=205694 RepID=A0ABD1W7T5_9LAMI
MSAQLVSEKPVSLSRAAKLLSRFAAVDNGSSGAVPLYLQRTADSFNHLVQFHSKHKMNELQNYPDLERVQKLWRDRVSNNNDNGENENPQDTTEPSLDEGNKKYSKIDKKMPEVINLENGVLGQEKRERKKRKSGKFDAGDKLQKHKNDDDEEFIEPENIERFASAFNADEDNEDDGDEIIPVRDTHLENLGISLEIDENNAEIIDEEVANVINLKPIKDHIDLDTQVKKSSGGGGSELGLSFYFLVKNGKIGGTSRR